MSDDQTRITDLIQLMSRRFAGISNGILDSLRELLDEGRGIVNCSESALLVPDAEGSRLKFLVSVNSQPGLAELVTQISIPRDGSIVGCVFGSGQLMAVSDPEDFYQAVSDKTGLNMSEYLVTPVVSGEDVIGVATFLNRPEGQPQEPFNEQEMNASMQLAELAATGLKFYQRMLMQHRLFRKDLATVARQFASDDDESVVDLDTQFDQADEFVEQSPVVRAVMDLEGMSRSEQGMVADLIGILSSHLQENDLEY